jgi:hypothetical protein
LLPFRKLASPGKVNPEQCGDAVDYQETILVFRHLGSRCHNELHLLLMGECPCVQDVIKHLSRIDPEPRGDWGNSLGTKCPFPEPPP